MNDHSKPKHKVPIVRMIEAYKNINEGLIYEEELNSVTEEDLEKIYGYQEKDPLFYDVYEINESNVKYFENKVNHPIELEKYLYVIACYQAE